jgi:hypothetical protein
MAMKWFVCSMANDGRGRPVSLMTDNVGQLQKFVQEHDKPGRAVYRAPNPLKDIATRRSKDDIEAIVSLHFDLDFKRIADAPEKVCEKLLALPLPFEIVETGGGIHLYLELKEAYENGTEHFRRAEELRTLVTERLCCDPAPNHSAALMRVVGTHNSKYDPPAEVQVIRAGMPVDLTDVEAFLDLFPGPLFTVKEEYTTAPDNVVTLDVSYSPIDYEAVLADMPTTGQGINSVQYRLLRALIVRDGRTPQEAVDIVVNATMDMAASHHPNWTAQAEVKFVTSRMNWVLGCLQKQHWKHVKTGNVSADAIPDWLPAEWHETWLTLAAKGGRTFRATLAAGTCAA